MKLLFYGNCQVEAAMKVLLACNPGLECEYAGNSNRLPIYDPDRSRRLFDWCEHIVTQPVMNKDNADFHEVLRKDHAGKLTFMAYFWLDGVHSLMCIPPIVIQGVEKSAARYLGEDQLIKHIQSNGFAKTVADYKEGQIDFAHRARFDGTMAELGRREAQCDIRLAPYMLECYRDEIVMLTHNHPHPNLVNEVARLLADRLGLAFRPITRADPQRYADITLGEYGSVLTPSAVEELGLRMPYDLQWVANGIRILQDVGRAMQARQLSANTAAG